MRLETYKKWQAVANHLDLQYAEGRVRITLCTPEMVRIQAAPPGEQFAPDGPAIVKRRCRGGPLAVEEGEEEIKIHTASLEIKIGKNPFRLDVYDLEGHAINGDGGPGIEWDKDGVRMVWRVEPEEEFFGFGLQFHRFRQRGATRFLKTSADPTPENENGQSHVVVPFFLSTQGYGVFLNSSRYTTFDMGATSSDRYVFGTPGDKLDAYFIYGSAPKTILSRYTTIVGRMPLPPKWGLGLWYRMRSYPPEQAWPAEKVLEVAGEFRKRGIPCDVIGLEPNWQTHSYSCSYVWNREQFPDPAGFIRELKKQGFHLNLWEHAYVHSSSPIYQELEKEGCAADKKVWDGLVPDFTLPKTREIFKNFHRREHVDLGVDGYKLDECDGSDFTGGWFFPDDTRFPGGMSGAEMHNLFGFLYQQTMHELFEEPGRRTYFLCRGNFAGAQRYLSCAASDYYDLRAYVRALVNSGFTGVLWCPEVRQTQSAEEFIRRVQVMFFSPLAQVNAWADGVTPWEKGPEVERIFRSYAELRMRLIPYIYSAWWTMSQSGVPFIRPLVLDYPDDPATYDVDDQYFFGDALMIAPVLEGTERQIYLPQGKWTDFWTEEVYQGGQTIAYTAPLERIPVFVKAGAIIPMAPAMNYAGEQPMEEIEVAVYPSSDWTASTLYEDDGETFAYRNGKWGTVRFACRQETGQVIIRLGKPRRSYPWSLQAVKFGIHGCSREPSGVQVNGRKLPRIGNDLEGTAGWRFDANRSIVWVRVPFGKAQAIRLETR